MSIVLIRHGETLLNAARTLQPADTPLGPRGLAQAQALARRLGAGGVRAILSSDLPRALQTAGILGAACGLPVMVEPLLQERNFGDLRGRPYDALGFDPLAMTDAPPGGESATAFRERVARAFARIVALRTTLDGDLAVVTHGLLIHALLERHARFGAGSALPARLGNTSVTILHAEAPHGVTLLDCTAHLTGAVADDVRSLAGA